jgi:hypothetical protein
MTVIMHLVLTLQSPMVALYTTRFNIKTLHIVPRKYVRVFCMDLQTKGDYYPILY